MKALILAAGKGKRLRPLTFKIPKCLVKVKGKPLLFHWLKSIESTDIENVFINTHWLADEVENYLSKEKFNLRVSTKFEKELLGSAGTISFNFNSFKNDDLLVIYGDNYTQFNLNEIISFHKKNEREVTVGAFLTDNPTKCGILEIDEYLNGISFIEKPSLPKSNLAAAGIYIFSKNILKKINTLKINYNGAYDIGYHVMPKIIRKSKIFKIEGHLIDIGDIDSLNFANSLKE